MFQSKLCQGEGMLYFTLISPDSPWIYSIWMDGWSGIISWRVPSFVQVPGNRKVNMWRNYDDDDVSWYKWDLDGYLMDSNENARFHSSHIHSRTQSERESSILLPISSATNIKLKPSILSLFCRACFEHFKIETFFQYAQDIAWVGVAVEWRMLIELECTSVMMSTTMMVVVYPATYKQANIWFPRKPESEQLWASRVCAAWFNLCVCFLDLISSCAWWWWYIGSVWMARMHAYVY